MTNEQIDDTYLQEIQSLKEKLKIAVKLLLDYGYKDEEHSFMHSIGSVDFKQWIDEHLEHSREIERLKEINKKRLKSATNKEITIQALESEIERLKTDKERIITLTIQWEQKACDRLNHEILPMKAEIKRLKAENEATKDLINRCKESDNPWGLLFKENN